MSKSEWHLDESLAAGLIANRLSPADRNRAVRHLLAGCDSCKALVNRILSLTGLAPEVEDGFPPPLSAASARASADGMDMDSLAGDLQWSAIERLPPKRRLSFLKSSPRHCTLGTFEAGLAAVRQASHRNPAEAQEMAGLLVELAELIEPDLQDRELRYDWRADAHVALARARAAAGDFRGAQAALDAGEAFLAYGTGDETDRAMFLVQQAGLLADLGELEHAVAVLGQALPLFRRTDDRNGEAKVLLHQALILRHLDPSRALALAEEGLSKLDPGQEPRAELSGHYTRAYCHNEIGDTARAEEILAAQRRLIDQFSEPSVRLSVEWLEARIRARQGRLAEAEQRLRAVLARYLGHRFPFEAVLTAVDLIELLVRQDRAAEGLYLVQEVLPILRGWGLHRDSLAVLLLLSEHLAEKRCEAETFRLLADQLRRTWHRNGAAGLPRH